MKTALFRILVSAVVPISILSAQAQVTPSVAQTPPSTGMVRETYVLGPGDQITIRAFEVEEISDKPFRIDSEGNIDLPVLGKLHAGGLTVEKFEADLTQRLKSIVKNPQVVVNVVQFRSDPVFFVGAFKAPGVYPLQGRRTLVEMLTAIGGTLPNADHRLRVTRQMEFGRIPLPNARVDPDGKVSTVEISLGSLTESMNSAEDIVLQPYDRISVERAEMVYVNGEVNKVGGVELGERTSITITQLISMVGGISKDAAPEKARILRPVLDTSRRAEIPVNLKRILTGEQADFSLLPNDVLYVPRSSHKISLSTLSLIAVPALTAVITVVATKF